MREVRAAAVIPAGGSGSRMGAVGQLPKQYLELAGRLILARTVDVFLGHPAFVQVVVALPADDVESARRFLPDGVTAVAGGPTRGDSVRQGLEAVRPDVDVVLIHDAARPLVTGPVVERVLKRAVEGVGAIAAVPVADTLKRAGSDGAILETVDREGVWLAQTPQGFPRRMVLEAYRAAAGQGLAATDDAAVVEWAGGRVVVVEGDARNIKITRPEDLALAEAFLAMGDRA